MIAIVAVDQSWGIGFEGELLVTLPEDQKDTFKRFTLGHTIIYGRKTLCTFPGERLLPGRTNIILSRNPHFAKEGAIVLHSHDEVLTYAAERPDEEIYLIGGAEVYAGLLPYCREAIVTRIHHAFSADAFFPNLDLDPSWIEVSCSDVVHSVKGYDFTVCRYLHLENQIQVDNF
jgi:dihydrofolate reductase